MPLKSLPQMHACDSSAFSAHGFDPATQTLCLTFKSSGKTYTYPEVSSDLANSRLAPGLSIGKWYSEHIKGKYIGEEFVPAKTDAGEAA